MTPNMELNRESMRESMTVRPTLMSYTATRRRAALVIVVLLVLAPVRATAAAHSFEFVAEHLSEVAMDNRFATLPLWSGGTTLGGSWEFTVQGAVARTGSGGLTLGGPMWSAAAQRQLNDRWSVRAFGFLDDLRFSGASDQRPLETLFTQTPLALPADALFTDLHGTYRNAGAGVAFNLKDRGWLGERQWVIGALYQRVELRDYRATYRVLEGSSSGATGFVDYSGDYAHLTPFAGLALPRHFGSWSLAPHALFAIPVPRRGIQGRITGPGFDLSGDTAKAGNGKHFGDISVTVGLDVTYEPWGLTLDFGSFVSQALLERVAHKGIDRNWVISAYKRF
ncbi:MAG TPA: hypothetical protein VFV04_03630 [Burkholderiales bacterium]|nr:hypothetical protein [Burkholderiales bacterium]